MNSASHGLLESVAQLAKEAGEKILAIYRCGQEAQVSLKSDRSPLTEADLAAHHAIVAGLKQLTPELPILSEESLAVSYEERSSWQRYWLVDPLDGTKEFIERTDDFTVNIALIEDHQPILGVVYAPVLQVCYFAEQGKAAQKQIQQQPVTQIHSAKSNRDAVIVVTSRRHGLAELQTFLAHLGNHTIIHRGSALKFCLVAEGVADLYPRFGPTSEWDTAAGQCIVEAAGGKVADLNGQRLRYNTRESLVNPSFLVTGKSN